MNSRERIRTALNHQEPDRIPLDLGAGYQTGMHVQMVYRLRQALKLDTPGTPVKVVEPYQCLGEIKPDLLEFVGGDVVGVNPRMTMFGYDGCTGWKEWEAFDGTPVWVPEHFNIEPEPDGRLFQYPEGDRSVPPSAVMPEGGYYFDSIIRQPPIDDANLKVEDNIEEFGPLSEEDVTYFQRKVTQLYQDTDKAIYINIGGMAFGDIALVPAPWLRHPKGIRDIEEWYISTAIRQDYIRQIFEHQCAVALDNLRRVYTAVGDMVDVIFISGTDFGSQQRPFMSVQTYLDLFFPFHKRINDWVHENTKWKTFFHTDGAILPLIPHLIEAGVDILNPIQWTASNMDPAEIQRRFGEQLVFWGGGIDCQHTLPFGTPDDVRREVRQRIMDFRIGGGWVWNTMHNVQPLVPIENLLAMYETIQEHRNY